MNQGHSLENFGARLRDFLTARAALRGRELLSAQFDAWALELFSLHFERNPVYRRFCENRGITAAGIEHWREVPAVPTAAFKELELTCIPKTQRTVVFYSSGTTAQRPSRHFHHAASLEVYEASLLAGFTKQFAYRTVQPDHQNSSPALDLPPAQGHWEHALALTPDPTQAPHSSLVHMFGTLGRRLNFGSMTFTGLVSENGAWQLDAARTAALLGQASTENKPILLLGTAFSYVHLLDHLLEHGLTLRLPGGSRVLETGGYKGRSRVLPKSELHALITTHLGIQPQNILCEYGMSELSSQAYNQVTVLEQSDQARAIAAKPHFQFPPWARAQIISPETGNEVEEGETGLVRILDLANVYSVMAVQTEDLGIRRGDGFELIGRAVLAEPRGCSLMAP